MPESRSRRSPAYTPPPKPVRKGPSPVWLAPLMVALFVLGVLWLATYYITGGEIVGMQELGNWNLLVGFAFIAAGFALSTRWR